MKKLINIAIIISLGILTAFATEENIVAHFITENRSPAPYHIQLTSITDPSNIKIYEIPAFSKLNFEIDQSINEWENTKGIVITKYNQDEFDLHLKYIHGATMMSRIENDQKHKKGRAADFSNEINAYKNENESLSLQTPLQDTFIVKNEANTISYHLISDDKNNEDGKIHKYIALVIAEKNDQLTFTIDKKNNSEHPSPFFYEITGNNIDPNHPVYLLGTCHTLSPDDYTQEIRTKIENTEILISEFPQFSAEISRAQATLNGFNFAYNKFLSQDLYWFRDQFIALNFSPNAIHNAILLIQNERKNLANPNFFESWFTQLTETEQEIVKKISEKSNINLSLIHPKLLPILIPIIGDIHLEKEHIEDSLEIHLIKLFTANNKEVIYLDTTETLLLSFVNDNFHRDFYKSLDKSIQEIKDDIITTWQQSESNTKSHCWYSDEYFAAFDFNKLFSTELEDAESMNARNIAWQKPILEALKSGKSASIITGAAHLLGKTGVLHFLLTHGYKIKHASIDEETQNKIDQLINFPQWLQDFHSDLNQEDNRLLEIN